MPIQLIGFPGGYTHEVSITLEELGLPYDFSETTFKVLGTPEFLASNHPFARVPVLIDDGFKLYETEAITRYLVKKYQGKKNSTVLIPTDEKKAALVDQFISVGNSYYIPILFKLVDEELVVELKGLTKNPEIIKEALGEIDNTLTVYEKLLEGKEYLAGEFSLADILHVPFTQLAIMCGHGFWNDPKRPNVARWWKNISERPCCKKIGAEIGIPKV
ncbi:glutathione S-transferase [Rhizophagus irregularis]|uniref:Glutathione S-transferase n=1 Tax=Rhizophagus irregularis TaxID=588596 RepID=A0A2I1F940_9GLOM|nr:glutathione S-transferase [Rhizophagus irregularis]PKY30899.1 glutathione S-transferase [Rhizophagus irregularis]CAB4473308.1 unnamed protein product [Rhizophagus irregularis]CAB5152532.1 unnamed protein product [Rhizophagus irregularis]CAB5338735.1 unnamed protein product [Rhizophagus irregularis]